MGIFRPIPLDLDDCPSHGQRETGERPPQLTAIASQRDAIGACGRVVPRGQRSEGPAEEGEDRPQRAPPTAAAAAEVALLEHSHEMPRARSQVADDENDDCSPLLRVLRGIHVEGQWQHLGIAGGAYHRVLLVVCWPLRSVGVLEDAGVLHHLLVHALVRRHHQDVEDRPVAVVFRVRWHPDLQELLVAAPEVGLLVEVSLVVPGRRLGRIGQRPSWADCASLRRPMADGAGVLGGQATVDVQPEE